MRAFHIRLTCPRPDFVRYPTMQPNSKINLALTMAILMLVCLTTGLHANRLSLRGKGDPKHGLKGLLNQAELFIKNKLKPAFFGDGAGQATTPPENRFLVVHTDATWTEALTILIDNEADDTTSSIWLYGDMPRWNTRHADHLWSFACGRTEGKWPMCGKEGYGPDPFDPVSVRDYEAKISALHGYKQDHKHMRRRRAESNKPRRGAIAPVSVGFAMDLNLLQGANSKHAHGAILQHDVKVVVLESKSLTRCTLRDAAFGNVSPLTASVPGRKTGVARAQFAPDAHSATTDASLLAKKRHMLICNEARDPSIMLHALHRHESNRLGMQQLKERLTKEKVSVLSVAIEDLLAEPAKTLASIMAFVTPVTTTTTNSNKHRVVNVSPELITIFRGLEVNDVILEDCADAMHRARVQLAVQDDTDKDLIIDLDAVLENVVVKRKIKLLHDSSKKGHKERNEAERRLAREERIAKATAKAKAKQSRSSKTAVIRGKHHRK